MSDNDPPLSAGETVDLERALLTALDSAREVPLTAAGHWLSCAFGPTGPWPEGERGERLIARARAVFDERRPGVLRLLFRRLRDAIEVAGVGLERLEPGLARSEGGVDHGVLVRHRLGDREFTAYVRATPSGRFDLTLDLWGEPRRDGTRISLHRGGRELVSELTRSGRTQLVELVPGRYRVVVDEGGECVGELDLTFEDAAA